MKQHTDWIAEDSYWESNYNTRPYAGTNAYDYYRPGYRFGYDAANRYQDRRWEEVEADLERDWDRYEHRSQSTWQQMKDAVRDAWNRVTGHAPVGTR